MPTPRIRDTSPGCELFPEFGTLYDLIAREVAGLSEAQLDFQTDRWPWAHWSIRRQLSHMASLIYSWLLVRWGPTLFPHGDHGVPHLQELTASGFDRCLDEQRYWRVDTILQALYDAIALMQRVLAQHTIGFLRRHTLRRDFPAHWRMMRQAHAVGLQPADEPGKLVMTLEASIRHVYFEETTHLFNIQRLKRAQGLPAVVEVPRVGYWVLEEWDRSEAP